MADKFTNLNARRATALAAAEAILKSVEAANRTFTQTENRDFDAHMAIVNDCDAQIEKINQVRAAANETFDRVAGANGYGQNGKGQGTAPNRANLSARTVKALEALTPYLHSGDHGNLAERIQMSDVPLYVVQSPQSGAVAAIPTDVVQEVLQMFYAADICAQLGVYDIARENTNPLVISMMTAAPASSVQSEGAGKSESTPPTFKTVTLTGDRYENLTKVSYEALASVGFDLAPQVIQAIGLGQLQKQATDFITQLEAAVVANSHSRVDNAGWDQHTVLSKMIASLSLAFQSNAKFLIGQYGLFSIMDARDRQGRPLVDITAGTILGKPYVVSEDVSAAGVYYGNWRLGAYRSRSPLEIQVLRELYSEEGMIGYKGRQVTDFAYTASLTDVVKQPVLFSTLDTAGS